MTWYDDMHRRLDALERFEAEVKERMPSAKVLGYGSRRSGALASEVFLEFQSGRGSWVVDVCTGFSDGDFWVVTHSDLNSLMARQFRFNACIDQSYAFHSPSAAVGHVLELLRVEPDAVVAGMLDESTVARRPWSKS